MKYFQWLFFLSFICTSVFAAESDFRFASLRQKAMGGAAIAIADDHHALYQNPAGLSQIKGFHLDLLRLRPEFNDGVLSKSSELNSLQSTTDQASQINLIKQLIPLDIGIRAGLSGASLSFTGFAVGVYTDTSIYAGLKNKAAPTLKIQANADAAAMGGLAFGVNLMGLETTVGFTGKYIPVRVGLINEKKGTTVVELGIADMLKMAGGGEFTDYDYTMSSGMGFDIGTLSAIHTPFGSGKVGFVLKNIATTLQGEKFLGGSSTGTAYQAEVPMVAAVGIGLQTGLPVYIPLISDVLGDMTVAADYQFISPEKSIYKNLHMGIEKGILFNIIKLRGGLNQGFVVGGIGLHLLVFHLDYAYYKEALGSEITINSVAHHLLEIGMYF